MIALKGTVEARNNAAIHNLQPRPRTREGEVGMAVPNRSSVCNQNRTVDAIYTSEVSIDYTTGG